MQKEVVREYEEQTLAEDQDQLDEVDEEGEEVEVDMDEDVDDEEEQEKKETPSEEIVSENVISAEAAAASTLALYKDVINDFLGVINFPKFNQEHGQQLSKLEDEERRPDFWDSLREAEEEEVEEEEKEVDERFQSEEVSQYSYGSFLSEVYRVTLERMKQRVKI